MAGKSRPSGVAARRLAIDALVRIDHDRAYANLVLPPMLERSSLDSRDRSLVTALVYGVTRMRRALDFLIDGYLLEPVDPPTRAALRLGAYQLHYLDTPPHAAVGATVGAVRGRARGLVNAVLRRVAQRGAVAWPDDAVRLSYPDWIVNLLSEELGPEPARAALEAMNAPAVVHRRDDGYVQDPASGLVVDAVEAGPGMRVADVCAAPGGKATLLAARGATVVASDLRPNRTRLIARNIASLAGRGPVHAGSVAVVTADAAAPPFRSAAFDRVLIDAPCSGLGSLRRRPDARWQIDPDAPARLAELQVQLVTAALGLLKPGGMAIYSVCTLSRAETGGVLAALRLPDDIEVVERPAGWPTAPWDQSGAIGLMPPGENDGMAIFRLRRH